MILADTSVWIDHLRNGDAELVRLLGAGRIACHELVISELALGSLRDRGQVLGLLDGLPRLPVAEAGELRGRMIETRRLWARGVGHVDCALLAACLLSPGTVLWTRDRRLREVAAEAGIARVAPMPGD